MLMEEDSVWVVGKGCNCQKRWQNTDLVDFRDDSDGICHPSLPFLGDSAVWNFVHKTSSTDFPLPATKHFSVLLVLAATGRQHVASP